MARRILNYGLAATHKRITNLANFADTDVVSNYDAFIFDSEALRKQGAANNHAFERKKSEIGDLVRLKGGLVLSVLRPPMTIGFMYGGEANGLSILEGADLRASSAVRETLRLGTITQWDLLQSAKGPTVEYVRALKGHLRPQAYLAQDTTRVEDYNGTVVAASSVGWPVSAEFHSGTGRICFVPVAEGAPDGQVGAAIARMVEEHFGGLGEIESPAWVDGVPVPGADAHDARIAQLSAEAERLMAEASRFSKERQCLLSFRVLLYGYGDSLLEPVVRRTFREFGFTVLEPDEYEGDWDLDLADDETSRSAVGEVEGSDDAINVRKLRQLLNYVEGEEDAGRKRKGILVGNGYRLKGLDEPERAVQFTERALKEATGFGYCLVPTTELFKAVCAVLRSGDEGLKKTIRDSILAKVGVWEFAE